MNGDTRSNATDPIERLRLSMNAVVDQHHTRTDAWGSIREGVMHGGIRPAPFSAPRRPAGLRLLAAAAVLLVVCAGVTVATRRDGPTDLKVATGQFAGGQPDPNGWYIPQDLPVGWNLKAINVTTTERRCPCRSAVWSGDGADTWVWFTTEALPAGYDGAPALDEDKIPKVDLGNGISGLLPGSVGDGSWGLRWKAGGYSYGIAASGIDRTQAAALGKAFVADSNLDDLPVPEQGLELTKEWNATATVPDLQLDVTYVAPSGNDVGYSLRSVDHLVAMSPQYHEIPGGSLPGQALPLLRNDDKLRISPTRNLDYPIYLGRWPGAVVRAPGSVELGPEGDPVPTQVENETLLSSLRPVTPAQWRTFARGAPSFDPKVVRFESVQDLAAG